jgi:rubrerythrin
MHVKLVELMADEAKLDFENFRTLLEWIIDDEKRHEQILKMIENALAEREK